MPWLTLIFEFDPKKIFWASEKLPRFTSHHIHFSMLIERKKKINTKFIARIIRKINFVMWWCIASLTLFILVVFISSAHYLCFTSTILRCDIVVVYIHSNRTAENLINYYLAAYRRHTEKIYIKISRWSGWKWKRKERRKEKMSKKIEWMFCLHFFALTFFFFFHHPHPIHQIVVKLKLISINFSFAEFDRWNKFNLITSSCCWAEQAPSYKFGIQFWLNFHSSNFFLLTFQAASNDDAKCCVEWEFKASARCDSSETPTLDANEAHEKTKSI